MPSRSPELSATTAREAKAIRSADRTVRTSAVGRASIQTNPASENGSSRLKAAAAPLHAISDATRPIPNAIHELRVSSGKRADVA